MDKAMNMGKSSATGSFQMLIGVASSTIIMAVGIIILGRLLASSAEYALYGAALIPISIINFFRDWGVNSAMTKQIASLKASDKNAEIHDIIVSGVVFEIISGIALSALCFVLSSSLAVILSGEFSTIPNAQSTMSLFIAINSLAILAGAIISAASAVFVGYERMNLNSFTLVCQAIVKTVVGPLLVVLGLGVLGATIGSVMSYIAGAIAGITIVYIALFRPLRKAKCSRCEIRKTLKPMLEYGVPLATSNVVFGILPLFFNFLMVIYAGSLYGDYLQAINFSVLLTFLVVPITTVLFPTFSKLNPEKEPELMKTVYASSVKYAAILIVPATMAMIVLSTPMINTLFGYLPTGDPKYAFAPLFLTLAVLTNLFVALGNLSMGTFLAGLGETKLLMKQGLLTLSIGLPLAFILVPTFGIIGGILGSLVASVPSMLWGLYWIWKRYKVKADFLAAGKTVAASSIAAAVTYLFLTILVAADWIQLASGFAIFLVIYLITAPLIGAINQTDINNLRTMLSGLGVVSKLLEIPFKLIEKTLKLRHTQK